MSTQTEALIRICEALPEDKHAEVADFAQFLLEREDDARWERIIADPAPRPKLEAFMEASRAEGGKRRSTWVACDLDDSPELLARYRTVIGEEGNRPH